MLLYWMFGLNILIIIIVVFIFLRIILKRKQIFETDNIEKYDVFAIVEDKFIVLGGFVFTYNIDEIVKIVFSVSRIRYTYIGKMKIFKTNGKNRSFTFDSGCIKKRLVFFNTEKDIEDTIKYLQEKLKYSGIPNYKV